MCISWNTHPVGPCTSFYACQGWESFTCILQSQTSKNVFSPPLALPYPGKAIDIDAHKVGIMPTRI